MARSLDVSLSPRGRRMSRRPTVIKLGGDALATPERIATAAATLAARAAREPIVLVASARRGVTDQLLALADAVDEALEGARLPTSARADAALARAITSGEVVSASLLARALERLGTPAVALDAREAGIRAGHGGIPIVTPEPILRFLERGVTPVVTGYQAWDRGRVTTLGRGGSDTTAIALTLALDAERCELVKETGGLLDADPALVAEARPLPVVTHRFLAHLASAGANVVNAVAAELAHARRVPLRLTGLRGGVETVVEGSVEGHRLQAVAVRHLGPASDEALVTAVSHGYPEAEAVLRRLRDAVGTSGVPLLDVETAQGAEHVAFRVPRAEAARTARVLHAEFAAHVVLERRRA